MTTTEIKQILTMLEEGKTEQLKADLKKQLQDAPKPIPRKNAIAYKAMQDFYELLPSSTEYRNRAILPTPEDGTLVFLSEYIAVVTRHPCPKYLKEFLDPLPMEPADIPFPKLPPLRSMQTLKWTDTLNALRQHGYINMYQQFQNLPKSRYLFIHGKAHYMACFADLAIRMLNADDYFEITDSSEIEKATDMLEIKTALGTAYIAPFIYSGQSKTVIPLVQGPI